MEQQCGDRFSDVCGVCISGSRRPPAETTARGAFKNRHGSTSPAEAMHFVLLWCPPEDVPTITPGSGS